MTCRRSFEITCDHGGKNAFICSTPDYISGGETVSAARAYLRTAGWTYRDGLDLCPDHTPVGTARGMGATTTDPAREG